jgi:hypothetical protein
MDERKDCNVSPMHSKLAKPLVDPHQLDHPLLRVNHLQNRFGNQRQSMQYSFDTIGQQDSSNECIPCRTIKDRPGPEIFTTINKIWNKYKTHKIQCTKQFFEIMLCRTIFLFFQQDTWNVFAECCKVHIYEENGM